ncbi:hypothetical protein [Arenimonas sp.]|uniref:hypothetical protein n=1 Tax=Arenimonas sp. TaxID=1872635 RepID=UPI0039E2CC6A
MQPLPAGGGSIQALAVMKSNDPLYPAIEAIWAGPIGEGMQLELACEVAGVRTYFASFVADPDDEMLSLEINVHGQTVRIPLDQLEEWIAVARTDVHSEAWYDKNVQGTDS